MAASRSAGVRRLMLEAKELNTPTDMYFAQPSEDNLFEWHFTIRGPPDSPYEGGVYHGRIILPHDYPMKPPSLMMLTPTGRFETNSKICLSISDYHPETWLPSWSIGTALVALIAFMSTPGNGAVGSIEANETQRKNFAKKSVSWTCPTCGCNMQDVLNQMNAKLHPKPEAGDAQPASTEAQCNEISTPAESGTESVASSLITAEQTPPTEASSEPQTPPAISPISQPINQTLPAPSVQTVPQAAPVNRQAAPASSSSTGFLIFVFSAIFFALIFRRISMSVS